jgi:hypothetical protein
MEIPVDLTNIEEMGDAAPIGEYLAQVGKIDVKDSKRTPGNKNLEVQFVLQEGEQHGKMVFETMSLSPKALWRVRDFVNACGVYPNPSGFKTEELIGRFLYITLDVEQRMQQDQAGNLKPVEGKMRNRVTSYRAQ